MFFRFSHLFDAALKKWAKIPFDTFHNLVRRNMRSPPQKFSLQDFEQKGMTPGIGEETGFLFR